MARLVAFAFLALVLVGGVNALTRIDVASEGRSTTALPPCHDFTVAMAASGEQCSIVEPCLGDDEDCRRTIHSSGSSGMASGSGGFASGDGSGSGETGSGNDESSAGGRSESEIHCLDSMNIERTVRCKPIISTSNPTPTVNPVKPTLTTPSAGSTTLHVPTPTADASTADASTTKRQPTATPSDADTTSRRDVAVATASKMAPTATATVRPDRDGGQNENANGDNDEDEDAGNNDQLVTIVGIGVGAFVGCVVLAVFATIIVLRYKQSQGGRYMVDAEVDSQRSGSSGSNSSTSSTTPLQKKSHFV